MEITFKPTLAPASVTRRARSLTENCSVNWLKTRNSPELAGASMASCTHRTVSRMSRKPRVWPPLP